VSELFGEVIYSYSRAQAIADGELVDVTESVRYALPDIPNVAMTRSVYADLEDASGTPSDGDGSDSRLSENILSTVAAGWDAVLGRLPVEEIRNGEESGDRIDFRSTLYSGYSVHYGPGDDATPVLTIMQVGED
jgi:hypothetical protein